MVRGYLVQILVEKILTVNSATRCPVSATALSQYPPSPSPLSVVYGGQGGHAERSGRRDALFYGLAGCFPVHQRAGKS